MALNSRQQIFCDDSIGLCCHLYPYKNQLFFQLLPLLQLLILVLQHITLSFVQFQDCQWSIFRCYINIVAFCFVTYCYCCFNVVHYCYIVVTRCTFLSVCVLPFVTVTVLLFIVFCFVLSRLVLLFSVIAKLNRLNDLFSSHSYVRGILLTF